MSSCSTRLGLVVSVSAATLALPAHAANLYDAHQVDRIAAQSLNVLRAHEQQLRALESLPLDLDASYYWMPADFRDGTGGSYEGAWLSRMKLGLALRFPLTDEYVDDCRAPGGVGDSLQSSDAGAVASPNEQRPSSDAGAVASPDEQRPSSDAGAVASPDEQRPSSDAGAVASPNEQRPSSDAGAVASPNEQRLSSDAGSPPSPGEQPLPPGKTPLENCARRKRPAGYVGSTLSLGAALDMAIAGIRNRGPKDSAPYTFQSIMWASFGHGKWNVTGGLRVDRTWIGLNGFGQFAGDTTPTARLGAPPEAERAFRVADAQTLFSGLFYARWSSLSAGAVFGQSLATTLASAEPRTSLQAVRLLALPPTNVRENLLAGLIPGIGLNRIDGAADYYGEHYDELLASIAQGLPVASRPALYEVPIVFEGFSDYGVTLSATTQIKPDLFFRMAEVAFDTHSEAWPLGVRAQLFRRGDELVKGFSAYAGMGLGSGFGVRLVYDRDSPNPENFYSIPGATVYGIELFMDPKARS